LNSNDTSYCKQRQLIRQHMVDIMNIYMPYAY